MLPYTESSRPFPSGSGIVVGAGFYVIASRTLGVPYRPSALRAELLKSVLRTELAAWRNQAGAVALDFLESTMAEAAKRYWGRLAEMGLVEVVRPLILSAVMSLAHDSDEVLAYARQIRDLPEAAAFREWSAQLSRLLVDGTSSDLAKAFKKDLEAATEPLNRRLGVGKADGRVSIGYGPVSASKSFGLPPIGAYARRVAKRHVWLLQSLQDTVGELSRVSPRVEAVIYPRLPQWLMDQLRTSPVLWDNINFRP